MVSLYEVVDAFIVGESNFTNSGGQRDLKFLKLFNSGWLKPYQDKIIYIFRGQGPEEGFENGAVTDAFMRSELTRKGTEHAH